MPVEFSDLERLLEVSRMAVCTAYRRDGRPQMSLVTVGSFDGGLVFTTQGSRAKAKNLARDPRCALMVVTSDFRSYAVLDGDVELRTRENTDAETLRLYLREVYRATRGGQEHDNWEEYDQAMVDQERLAVILRPGRMVGVRLP
jgi:PPOX class probable F420-dependent enzyme